MKKVVSIVTFVAVLMASNGYAVTHTCKCNVLKIHAGFVGGTGNNTKSKVDCDSGTSYYLGVLDTELVKVRHSMALAAKMASKKVVLQYWSSDGSKNCGIASSDTTVYPDGMYVE